MKRSTRKQLPKFAAMGAALIACMVGVAYMGYSSLGQQIADEYGCYESYAPQTAFILDSSEPRFDIEQARALKNFTDQTYTNLRPNERFSVFTTEADVIGSVVKPRFHLCGQASNSEELDALAGADASTGFLKRQKERLYEELLRPQLHKLFALEADEERRQDNQSPILEMIKAVVRDTRLEAGDRLVLASDLIQSSESAQFCRTQNDLPTFENFKERRIYRDRLKPRPIEGVEVTVLMLLREGYGGAGLEWCRDEEELKDFYRSYFENNGASSIEFIRIRPALAEATQGRFSPKKHRAVAAEVATLMMNKHLSVVGSKALTEVPATTFKPDQVTRSLV